MQTFFLVGLGGFLGAGLRYAIGILFSYFPVILFSSTAWSVLIVNCLGSFTAGVLIEQIKDQALKALIITGFLGAFTTFSTFSNESFKFVKENQYFFFLIYVLLNTMGSLICFWLGSQIWSYNNA